MVPIAGEQGFEPRSATLKAAVLPLNHSPPVATILSGHVLCSKGYKKGNP